MDQLDNQPQQPNIPQEPQPTIQPEIPQKPSLPTWLIILITVLAIAVIFVIGVGGYAAYQYYYTLTSESEPAELPIAGERENSNPIANWQTYRNEKYGFEVKYPKQTLYEIKFFFGDKEQNKNTSVISNTYATKLEEADSIAIGWGPNSFFEIDFLSNQENLSLLEFIRNDIQTDNPYNQLSFDIIKNNGESTTLSNKEAYKFTADQCCLDTYKLIQGEQEFVYFKYNNTIIGRIAYHLTNPHDDHDNEHKIIFQKILSTFKFIEIDETADWQTYKNEEYGFEMKYLDKWQINELNNKQILFIDEERATAMRLGAMLRVEISENINTEDISEWLNDTFYKGAEKEIIPIYKSFIIDNIPAVRFSTPELSGCDDKVVFFKDNNAFLIYKFGDTCDHFSTNLYDQILSTFKFIE